MKAKRQAKARTISHQNIVITFVFGLLAFLIPILGTIYQLAERYTLPMAIASLWIAGSVAIWTFRKGESV